VTKHNDDNVIDDVARRPRPVTPEMRADVARLHAMRLGRNEIARELDIAGSTVTKICQAFDPPLDFERKDTALAVRARQIDLAAARPEIAAMLLVRATEVLEAMSTPITIGQFGGSENVWNETLLDEPTIEGKRNLVTIAGIAVQRHLDLVKVDAGRDLTTAESLVDDLAGFFEDAANALRASGASDPTATDTI
jgi:hypothetical protein